MEKGKANGNQNDTRLQGSYIFKKVTEGRCVLFGKEDLMRDFP